MPGWIAEPEHTDCARKQRDRVERDVAPTTEQWLDFLGISMDPKKAEGMRFTINLVTPDNGEKYAVELSNATLTTIKGFLAPRYAEFIGKEIQTAYLESYSEYGQNIFDRYVTYADYWIQDQEYRDTDTGEVFDRASLNAELEKIEKPAGIANPKDFRNEIVNFVLRARANNQGNNPVWTSYEKLRTVIEKKMFSNTEELLPVISFNAKASADEAKKHEDFVNRMVNKGYTGKQVRLLCEWYLRVRKSS